MRINSAYSDLAKSLEVNGSPAETQESSPTAFADELKESLKAVDQFQQGAEKAMQEGTVKGAENIHETMVQLEEADISLRFLLKVRNKALDGYQEIMRMQF